MTVAELIAALSAFAPDLPVLVAGYEGGAEELRVVRQTTFLRDDYEAIGCFGPHSVDLGDEPCVYLPRRSA